MSIKVCHTCNMHFLSTSMQCPNCVAEKSSSRKGLSLAILMGLGMIGCGEEKTDTAQEDTAQEDTAQENSSEPEPSAEDLYGVPQE